ncbi:Hsp70 family protein [Gordonia pseudamarae]|uniref:Hsp70 family protein n=1 Tax=Gordonia pseudamarae TaxID=2831662 RepID=A0ABX6IMS1_9ACTN|nr:MULTISPECIES: Hsp70 family protein [Gordonia]MBD0021229.1 Hsp70 family protein [Gordonia sp. (in: high G+C Gram-positive bacteria)]QHN27593.1 Hsp70 family protein [Gordonia pseudamarae]QHN36475.1 Hsp70 family protein [Gordonia pseudamarae]
MTISKLSIDFGTTNTAAAFVDRHGNLHEVRLSHTSTLMPSAVFADGDNLVVGAAAINLSATRPDAYEPNPKRRLREPNILLGDVRYKTTKLAAAVLRSAITTASTVHGGPFDQVILTHPDGWAGHMQARLRKAATRTGLHPQQITLITEAQAAAHFYSTNHDFPDDPRLCVFDFGAGTCDVAVLDRTPSGQYIVAASDGLEDLGGTDIDSRVYDWVLRHITANTPHIVGQIRSPHAALTLIDRVRDAKESLSTANRAIIPVPGGEPIQLTRNEFDSLIYRDVQRAVALTQRVITAANRSSNAPVGQIYLVGGSSHIPLVHRELSALGTIATLGDPKTVVVQGALARPAPVTPPPIPPDPGPRPDPTPPPPPPPPPKRRALVVGMLALAVVVATAIVAAVVVIAQNDDPPTPNNAGGSYEPAGSGTDVSDNSDGGTSADNGSTGEVLSGSGGCGFATETSPTERQCQLLAKMPSEIKSVATCDPTDPWRGSNTAVQCLPPSNASAPYYSVVLYDYSDSATEITAVNFSEPPENGTWPEPNSQNTWTTPTGTTGGRMYSFSTNAGTWHQICTTRWSTKTASCIGYDPRVRTATQVVGWWQNQVYL